MGTIKYTCIYTSCLITSKSLCLCLIHSREHAILTYYPFSSYDVLLSVLNLLLDAVCAKQIQSSISIIYYDANYKHVVLWVRYHLENVGNPHSGKQAHLRQPLNSFLTFAWENISIWHTYLFHTPYLYCLSILEIIRVWVCERFPLYQIPRWVRPHHFSSLTSMIDHLPFPTLTCTSLLRLQRWDFLVLQVTSDSMTTTSGWLRTTTSFFPASIRAVL